MPTTPPPPGSAGIDTDAPAATYPRRTTDDGPRGNRITGSAREYGADPIAATRRWRDRYGDLVRWRLGPLRVFSAFGPIEVTETLATHAKDYRKSLGVRKLSAVMGQGLLTDEGESWLRSRRLIAPAFHRERVATYAPAVVEAAEQQMAAWTDGDTVDMSAEMSALTLRVIARVLFDADVTDRVTEIAQLAASIQDHYFDRLNSLHFLIPDWLPTPGNRQLRHDVERLDAIVTGIISERDRDEDRGDLLSMLLTARDGDRPAFDEREVRDHIVTFLLAGHETTALLLTWTWLLLSRHPETRTKLEEELDHVLAGNRPSVDDVSRLPYTEAVLNESLRLRPPAYSTGREAVRDTTIDGVDVPKGHSVFVSMSTSHRDPRFFPEPDEFRPERWLDGLASDLPRGAFFPFGLGPRMCVGASFAMLEATLVVASCAQRWRFEDDVVDPGTRPAITLRPARPVTGRLHQRS